MRFTRGDVRDHIGSPKIDHGPPQRTLKSEAAAEKSIDRLSQFFWGCSIFDFCNSIPPEADIVRAGPHVSKAKNRSGQPCSITFYRRVARHAGAHGAESDEADRLCHCGRAFVAYSAARNGVGEGRTAAASRLA